MWIWGCRVLQFSGLELAFGILGFGVLGVSGLGVWDLGSLWFRVRLGES